MNTPFSKTIDIIFDVELSTEEEESMFSIAMGIQGDNHKRMAFVWYFKELVPVDPENGTYKWWMSKKERREFYIYSHNEHRLYNRQYVANNIRKILDACYAESEKVIFWGDFTVFDIGLVNKLLNEYGHLPAFYARHTVNQKPATCIAYNNYLTGLAGLPPTTKTAIAFKKLGIIKPESTISHNSEKDIHILMDTVQLVKSKALEMASS